MQIKHDKLTFVSEISLEEEQIPCSKVDFAAFGIEYSESSETVISSAQRNANSPDSSLRLKTFRAGNLREMIAKEGQGPISETTNGSRPASSRRSSWHSAQGSNQSQKGVKRPERRLSSVFLETLSRRFSMSTSI